MAWALKQEVASLNFAAVGAAWPGPAVYGYNDGEEEPVAACELLAELSRGGKGPEDVLFGSDEAVVPDDLAVVVPSSPLEGDRMVCVAGQFDEYGSYLLCAGESRRASLLAKLIVDEQGFESHAWGFADNGDAEVAADGRSADFDDTFALLAIEGNFIEFDERGRLPLGDTGLDGLKPGAHLGIGGNGETFFIAESGQEKRRSAQAEEDLSEMCFEGWRCAVIGLAKRRPGERPELLAAGASRCASPGLIAALPRRIRCSRYDARGGAPDAIICFRGAACI